MNKFIVFVFLLLFARFVSAGFTVIDIEPELLVSSSFPDSAPLQSEFKDGRYSIESKSGRDLTDSEYRELFEGFTPIPTVYTIGSILQNMALSGIYVKFSWDEIAKTYLLDFKYSGVVTSIKFDSLPTDKAFSAEILSKMLFEFYGIYNPPVENTRDDMYSTNCQWHDCYTAGPPLYFTMNLMFLQLYAGGGGYNGQDGAFEPEGHPNPEYINDEGEYEPVGHDIDPCEVDPYDCNRFNGMGEGNRHAPLLDPIQQELLKDLQKRLWDHAQEISDELKAMCEVDCVGNIRIITVRDRWLRPYGVFGVYQYLDQLPEESFKYLCFELPGSEGGECSQ